jgi:hypothetical protein
LPWVPALAVEESIVIRVHEGPGIRVPIEGTMMPIRQIFQMDNRHSTGPKLDVGDRTLARSNAIEPIAMVPRRLKNYPESQIYIGFFDQLSEDPYQLLAEIYEFLGLPVRDDTIPKGVHRKVNAHSYPPLPANLANHLARRYYPEVESLHQRFANTYTAHWLESTPKRQVQHQATAGRAVLRSPSGNTAVLLKNQNAFSAAKNCWVSTSLG